MAKSKSGGSRSYLRGKLGADVYSIGKDGKGAKQQVVRSLAEQVSNPQTEAQMFGRMIMSTVMQAVSAMSPIIDHSFDNMPAGQPNISEFIRRNYQLVSADAKSHAAGNNVFGLNAYKQKGVLGGPYIVSYGDQVLPEALSAVADSGVKIALPNTITAQTLTAKVVRDTVGLKHGEFFTLVSIGYDMNAAKFVFQFNRFRIDANTIADATVVTTANIFQVLVPEGNNLPTAHIDMTNGSQNITFNPAIFEDGLNAAVIVSRKIGGEWKHNTAYLMDGEFDAYCADAILPTYPTGTQRFLNGGEI